ncbi:hypothetical protein BBDE_1955 [Bifidobacterium dentium JCM 1195 = DSM 20436]|nr:hypothetical protein BBDE_1955 [Bifidobacterium dentium JCM 1195 = DSM 20436]
MSVSAALAKNSIQMMDNRNMKISLLFGQTFFENNKKIQEITVNTTPTK